MDSLPCASYLTRISSGLTVIRPVWRSVFIRSREKRELTEPRYVLIDPYVAFGRPVLTGTGIPTAVIADRYKAGESIDELAEDYGQDRFHIEEAIRCELAEAA